MDPSKVLDAPDSSGKSVSASSCRPGAAATPMNEHRKGSDQPEPKKEDKVNISMCGLGPYLRALAARRGTTPAALIRSEVTRMLDEEPISIDASTPGTAHKQPLVAEVRVSLSPAQASTLAIRSRASGISRSHYVRALIDGDPPPALPIDHNSLLTALLASTDRLAAMSVDLNTFMRLLNSAPAAQLESYRNGLLSIAGEIRAHLASAAAVLAEVKRMRRPNR